MCPQIFLLAHTCSWWIAFVCKPDVVGRIQCFCCESLKNCVCKCLNTVLFSSDAIPIRLMDGMIRDGRPISGPVEVKYQDIWGTVCANRFGPIEAAVICRQLGLQGGTVKNAFPSTDPNQQIWLHGLWCTGSESSLAHCSHNGRGQYAQVTVGGAQTVQFYACVHGNGDPVMDARVECDGMPVYQQLYPLSVLCCRFCPASFVVLSFPSPWDVHVDSILHYLNGGSNSNSNPHQDPPPAPQVKVAPLAGRPLDFPTPDRNNPRPPPPAGPPPPQLPPPLQF